MISSKSPVSIRCEVTYTVSTEDDGLDGCDGGIVDCVYVHPWTKKDTKLLNMMTMDGLENILSRRMDGCGCTD